MRIAPHSRMESTNLGLLYGVFAIVLALSFLSRLFFVQSSRSLVFFCLVSACLALPCLVLSFRVYF
jgi:hypothetical protein